MKLRGRLRDYHSLSCLAHVGGVGTSWDGGFVKEEEEVPGEKG